MYLLILFRDFHILAVCDFRLDFERFTTNGPAATDETSGGLCQDMLTTTVNTGQAIPEICGENSGQHSEYNTINQSTLLR